MKVTKLMVSNFRGIECREVVLNGGHLKVKGPNGSGKSSTALAFLWGLTGGGTKQPVRDGADQAEVRIDVGDFVFTRTAYTNGKPGAFTCRAKPGKVVPMSPAKFVESLVGSGLALNPLAIFSMRDEDQAAEIRRALKIDVAAEDKKSAAIYDERTAINKKKAVADARIQTLVERGVTDDAPAAVDAQVVIGALQVAETAAATRAKRVAECATAMSRHEEAIRLVERLKAELEQASGRLDVTRAARDATVAAVDELPDASADVARLRNELATLSDRNAKAKESAELRQLQVESEARRKESEKLTAAIDQITTECAGRIAKAATDAGLDGLQFTADRRGVNLRGVRLAELNATQRVKLGLRLAVATMPELRTAVIDQASEFDAKNMAELIQWGDSIDMQLVLACVEPNGTALEFEVFDGESEVVPTGT